MAVNNSRSMNGDFHQGSIDRTYIQLTPDRGEVENQPIERLTWPQFQNAERWAESAHFEAHVQHAQHPIERKSRYGSDPRF